MKTCFEFVFFMRILTFMVFFIFPLKQIPKKKVTILTFKSNFEDDQSSDIKKEIRLKIKV